MKRVPPWRNRADKDVVLRLSPALLERVDSFRKRTGAKSRTAVIREALRDYLERHDHGER